MPGGWHRKATGKFLSDSRISTHLEHAGIIPSDFETAKHFWVDQMGFTVVWDYKKDGVRTNLLHLRLPGPSGDHVELGNPVKPTAGKWIGVEAHAAFTVPDIQAADQQVLAHGYTGELKPPLFGADNRWQLNLYDPDGSRVEFTSPKPKGK
jgi:catechol 2,3-dioxygenase-like lactoylglutathione lyase family enzyme